MNRLIKAKEILQRLKKEELFPDEFVWGETVAEYIDVAISVIDNEYETEEEYNEVMENTFNTPLPIDNELTERTIK